MDEIQEAIRKFQKELSAGTSALVLLGVLSRAEAPMYGYQIAKLVEAGSNSSSIGKQGALYPVLRSLEASGLLASVVEPSVSGPPRRYYHITPNGRSILEKWKELWQQTRTFVDTMLEGGNDDEK